jgi:hypothetical protein
MFANRYLLGSGARSTDDIVGHARIQCQSSATELSYDIGNVIITHRPIRCPVLVVFLATDLSLSTFPK